MSVDEALIERLKQHTKLLLESIDSLHTISPPFQHIFLLPPNERPSVQASVGLSRQSLAACQNRVNDMAQPLQGVASMCSSIEQTLVLKINPIDSLPTELVQRIAGFFVESPSNYRRILDLMCVCKKWNIAVLGMSELFTSPDLVRWPESFVLKWLSRSASRPLTCDLRGISRSGHLAFTNLEKSVPMLTSRLQRLHISLLSEDFLEFAALCPGLVMPQLERLTINYPLCKEDGEIDLRSAILPMLHTLYTPELRVLIPSSVPALQNLGCRMAGIKDFEACVLALTTSETLRHMTLFSSVYDSLDEMPEPSREVRRSAPPLSSLRFQGYCDVRPNSLEPYVRGLSTLEFTTLEFTALDLRVYDMVIETLSRRKSCTIRELIVQSLWDFSELSVVQNVNDYLWPLGGNIRGSGTSGALPNLHSIIIQNVPSITKESSISIELAEPALARRRGTLKRLILPRNLEPKSYLTASREVKGADVTYVKYLNEAEVLRLSHLGQSEPLTPSVEIGFFWEVDNHGLDLYVEYIDEDVGGAPFRFRPSL